MATSPKHRGWLLDRTNGRLAAVYNGTEVFDFDANDVNFAQNVTMAGTLTVTGAFSQQDATFAGTLAATGDDGAAGGAATGDALTLTGGAGSSTTAACVAPGVGGAITITAGAGGASTAACDTAGAGGNLTLAAGAGGAATGCCATGGAAGDVIIRLPTAVNCGANGDLFILNSTTGVGLDAGAEACNVVTAAAGVGKVSYIASWAADWTTGADTGVLLIRLS